MDIFPITIAQAGSEQTFNHAMDHLQWFGTVFRKTYTDIFKKFHSEMENMCLFRPTEGIEHVYHNISLQLCVRRTFAELEAFLNT